MQNILAKIRRAYAEGRLSRALRSRVRSSGGRFFYGLLYLLHDPAGKSITLHCPDYVEPARDKDEMEIVERIFRSFRKMKEDQKGVSDLYRPSSLWQAQLDANYSYLTEGLRTNDMNKFHFFLSNFGTWDRYHGVESTTFIRDNMKSPVGRSYLKNAVFNKQLKLWKWFYNNRKPIPSLTYPTYGNQSGAYIEKTFVGLGSFFNEIYGSILSGLLVDIGRPVVADLGAGYGKLAHFILRDIKESCFVDFDLPETLCLAAYYLMKSWPNKKTLLYGEAEYSANLHDQYDLILMPSYEIRKCGEHSVDLFLNTTSLGEMTREVATNYISHITKATRYFFHMNHDNYPNIYSDSSRGLLGYEYPVSADQFKLLFRYADIGHALVGGRLNLDMDIFLYLYERKSLASDQQDH